MVAREWMGMGMGASMGMGMAGEGGTIFSRTCSGGGAKRLIVHTHIAGRGSSGRLE